MSLYAEKLLAVTGIFPTAAHPSETDLVAMDGISDAWKARAKRWLKAPDDPNYKRRTFESPDPPAEKTLQDRILKPIDGDEEARLRSAFPDPIMADEYLAAVRGARAYIDSRWPKIAVPGSVAEVFPLSKEELDDAWALVRIADNPEIIWDELEAESLSLPMIDCWRACYPELSLETLVMLDGLIIERQASKKHLTWQQQDLLHMLKGEAVETPLTIVKEQPKPKQENAGGNET